MSLRSLLICGAVLALPAAATAAPAPAPATGAAAVTGVWTTPDDKSRVRISRTAKGIFRGQIIWLKQPRYPKDFKDKSLAGKPKVDRHNPDKSLRDRPILGLDVLTGFHYLPKHDAWGKGKCYDPEEGKTYECRMWLTDGGKHLKVRGYVWIFHKTQTWTRYRAPAPASAAPAASAPPAASAARSGG